MLKQEIELSLHIETAFQDKSGSTTVASVRSTVKSIHPKSLPISDMRIVPVGYSGKVLGSFWFRIFFQDFHLLDYNNEAKSWWQPQIESTYMRK